MANVYTDLTTPGLGDPYWYEWSVGQQFLLKMLNEDNCIDCVELQANNSLGLDDVVVHYNDGNEVCIQVKHTRANDTLTFGDLVTAGNNNKSLLKELADGWVVEKNIHSNVEVRIFTNRRVGIQPSNTGGPIPHKRPSLKEFIGDLKSKLEVAKNFADIEFIEYEEAWKEWKQQLDGIKTDSDKIEFLNSLIIETNKADLDDIKNELLDSLAELFAIQKNQAEILMDKNNIHMVIN